MPPHKPNMGIVALNWYQIIRMIITECARKIKQIDSYSGDFQHET